MYPSKASSQAQIHGALLEYLNVNPHKFDVQGNFDPVPDERDRTPPSLLRYVSDRNGAGATAEEELSELASKATDCAMETWPEIGLATGLIGLGAGTIGKRFATKGSSPRTSIASKYLAPLIPGQFKHAIPAPTLRHPLATTKLLGRAVARWIPGIGWAILGYDAYKFGDCMMSDPDEAPSS